MCVCVYIYIYVPGSLQLSVGVAKIFVSLGFYVFFIGLEVQKEILLSHIISNLLFYDLLIFWMILLLFP